MGEKSHTSAEVTESQDLYWHYVTIMPRICPDTSSDVYYRSTVASSVFSNSNLFLPLFLCLIPFLTFKKLVIWDQRWNHWSISSSVCELPRFSVCPPGTWAVYCSMVCSLVLHHTEGYCFKRWSTSVWFQLSFCLSLWGSRQKVRSETGHFRHFSKCPV